MGTAQTDTFIQHSEQSKAKSMNFTITQAKKRQQQIITSEKLEPETVGQLCL